MLQENDISQDVINLDSAKLNGGSERIKPKDIKLIKNTRTEKKDSATSSHTGPTDIQSLEMVRKEIKQFLSKEKQTPTAKILQVISSVYENHLSLRDFEIKKLLATQEPSNENSMRQSKLSSSNQNRGKINSILTIFRIRQY